MNKELFELAFIGLIAVIFALSLSFGMNFYLKSSTPNVAVTTESMEPTYYGFQSSQIDPLDGDLLLVQYRDPEDIHKGDVIVFDNPTDTNERIVHRVIDVKNESGEFYYITKGDNPVSNISPDLHGRWGWVHYDYVHGVIVHRVPHIGWLALEIQKESIRWSLIIIAGLLLLLSLNSDNDEEESEEDENELLKKKSFLESFTFRNIQKSSMNSFNTFIHSRRMIIVGIIFIMISLSLTSNLQDAFNSCNVIITKQNTHKESYEVINGTQHYFIGMEVQIDSHGIFNHISSFDILHNGDLLYRWTIKYSFQGQKTLGVGLVLEIDPGTYSLEIDIDLHCSGIFAKGESIQETITIQI